MEVVRAVADAHNRGELDALLEAYDPKVEFVTLLLGTHQGKEAIRHIFEENRRNLPGYRLDPEEVIDARADRVIGVAHPGGTGRVSQIGLGARGSGSFRAHSAISAP